MTNEKMRSALYGNMYSAETFLRQVTARYGRDTSPHLPILGAKAKEALQTALDIQFCEDLKGCARAADPECAEQVDLWYSLSKNDWVAMKAPSCPDPPFHLSVARIFETKFEVWQKEQKRKAIQSTSSVRDKIEADYYSPAVPYPAQSTPLQARKEAIQRHRESMRVAMEQFKLDLFTETGMIDHPKREVLYNKAQDSVGGSGLQAVVSEFEELVALVRPD